MKTAPPLQQELSGFDKATYIRGLLSAAEIRLTNFEEDGSRTDLPGYTFGLYPCNDNDTGIIVTEYRPAQENEGKNGDLYTEISHSKAAWEVEAVRLFHVLFTGPLQPAFRSLGYDSVKIVDESGTELHKLTTPSLQGLTEAANNGIQFSSEVFTYGPHVHNQRARTKDLALGRFCLGGEKGYVGTHILYDAPGVALLSPRIIQFLRESAAISVADKSLAMDGEIPREQEDAWHPGRALGHLMLTSSHLQKLAQVMINPDGGPGVSPTPLEYFGFDIDIAIHPQGVRSSDKGRAAAETIVEHALKLARQE